MNERPSASDWIEVYALLFSIFGLLETFPFGVSSAWASFAFDFRFAEGKVERLPTLAAELVTQRPAVIATFGDATGLAAQAQPTRFSLVITPQYPPVTLTCADRVIA